MNYPSIIKGLNEAVKISKGEMKGRKQKVSIIPVADFTSEDIKVLRHKLHLSQLAFAQLIGVSKKTIEAWEKGTNKPNGPARRILGMLNDDPDLPEKHNIIAR